MLLSSLNSKFLMTLRKAKGWEKTKRERERKRGSVG
jgi:hypothetical protein